MHLNLKKTAVFLVHVPSIINENDEVLTSEITTSNCCLLTG